jgi:hypothetical protein
MSFCSTCGTAFVPGDPTCRRCNPAPATHIAEAEGIAATQPIAAREPPSPNAMRICTGCGTIAPTEASACKVCGGSLATVEHAEPRADGAMFALVLESDFQCRSCGLRATLDSLSVEPEVECHRCGTAQAFDVSQWKKSLAHAHSVADLAGPPPAGQGSLRHGVPLKGNNPFGAIGVKFSFAELQQSGMTISAAGMVQESLRVKVSTGHPVCPNKHGPLSVTLDGAGLTSVECKTCGGPASYKLPPKATELDSGCCGVIDDEHRSDRPRVRLQAGASGAAVALSCPSCNASLPATDGSSMVSCQFCRTVSYIPKRTLLRLDPQKEMHRPFWLLFRGPSATRTATTDEDARVAELKKAMKSEPRADGDANLAGGTGRVPAAGVAPRRSRAMPFIIGGVVLALAAAAVAAFLLLGSNEPHRHGGAPARHGARAH